MALLLTVENLPVTASCLVLGPLFITAPSLAAEDVRITLAVGSEEGSICLYAFDDKGAKYLVDRLETRSRIQSLFLFDTTRFGSVDLVVPLCSSLCCSPILVL